MTAAHAEPIADTYALLLRRWSSGRTEESLELAYSLGRQAFLQGVGIVRLMDIHHEALASLVADAANGAEAERTVRDAGIVSAECVSVFEMILRGFEESNTVLKAANAKLEEANEELDAFGYAVSHDLRAQVRTIDGYCSVLAELAAPRLDAESLAHLRVVQAATRRMGEIVEDLLRLSRAARSDLHIDEVDLTALVASVAETLARHQPERDVRVAVQSGMEAAGDARLLRIAFENLLGNAWKFTATARDPSVEVSQTDDEQMSVTTIRDNGVGFDMSQAERLFHPYQRLHNDPRFPGSGIGLATVRRIVERHGGRLSAQSRPGAGAAFTVALPHGPRAAERP